MYTIGKISGDDFSLDIHHWKNIYLTPSDWTFGIFKLFCTNFHKKHHFNFYKTQDGNRVIYPVYTYIVG